MTQRVEVEPKNATLTCFKKKTFASEISKGRVSFSRIPSRKYVIAKEDMFSKNNRRRPIKFGSQNFSNMADTV
jgi:hypothetical protein